MEQGDSPFRPEHFSRLDESDDAIFYEQPRLVTHIDDAAIDSARMFYGRVLPPGGAILDLMSSWVSHLPEPSPYARVTGLGMNEVELSGNPQLTDFVLQDLNRHPLLPFSDQEFDGAVCTVSAQYLTRPVEVFGEVGRVLRPNAPFILTYSNRLFPTKAVGVWQMLGDRERADLLATYFRLSGRFTPARAFDLSPNPGHSDPLYAVVAERTQ
jgi:SAM-dependent methyltransferase